MLKNKESLVGKVVVFDLVNGKQVTTLVKDVHDSYFTCGEMVMFVVNMETKNPSLPPSPTNIPEAVIRPLSYGYPIYNSEKINHIDFNHIITVFLPAKEQVDVYNTFTTGLVVANTNALNQLDDITKKI